MLSAYLDESYDPSNSGFYVVGGILGDGWRLLQAETRWRELLAKHRLLKYKTVNLTRREPVRAEFAEAIRESGLFAFALVAEQSSLRKHLGGSRLHKQYLESPYMLLYQLSFVRIAMKLRKLRSAGHVSFVCDENARYLAILARSYPELKKLNKISAPFMGSCTTDKDDTCIRLQMADLVAGEVRKKAPTWTPNTRDFPAPLQTLLDSRTLGWVSFLDERTLLSIRRIVDQQTENTHSTS